MADEPTLGEVMRRLEDVRQDLKEDIAQISTRLDGKVSLDIFELRMTAITKDIDAMTTEIGRIKTGQEERDRQRAADRRLLFTTLVAPVLMLLLSVYLSTRGAAS